MPDLQQEVAALRKEVEDFRLREVADLRQRLADAEDAAARYREDAYKNAALGHEIAAGYEQELSALRSKVTASENVNVRGRGDGR